MYPNFFQFFDSLLPSGIVEEIMDGFRDHRANLMNRGKILGGRAGDRINASEMARQNVRNPGTDVMNPQSGEQPIEPLRAALLDILDDLVCDLLANGSGDGLPLLLDLRGDVGDIIRLELVEVGEGMDEIALDELIDQDIADAFDIHLASPAEPAEAFLHLRRAGGVGAVNIDAGVEDFDFFAAGGARLGKL